MPTELEVQDCGEIIEETRLNAKAFVITAAVTLDYAGDIPILFCPYRQFFDCRHLPFIPYFFKADSTLPRLI